MTPNRFWCALFGFWILFLSGALVSVIGPPGVIQALRLNSLLQSKRAQVDRIQEQVHQLQLESSRLEQNHATQEREIRRVLGYAAPGEIIFDFTGDALK